MSESTTVYARLMEVQKAIKAPKDEVGRFGKSRSAESILAAAKPLCYAHELLLTLSDERGYTEGRHYVDATAAVTDKDGNTIGVTASAWEGEISRGLDASQVTGMASSYARKYALGGLFAIDDSKDADTAPEEKASHKQATEKGNITNPSPATAAQIQMMMGLVKHATGLVEREDLIAYFITVVGKTPDKVLGTEVGGVVKQLKEAARANEAQA